MTIYVVSCKPSDSFLNSLYGGVWGTFTSFDKARMQAECWIEHYEEEILDYKENCGKHTYITNAGQWFIEPCTLED